MCDKILFMSVVLMLVSSCSDPGEGYLVKVDSLDYAADASIQSANYASNIGDVDEDGSSLRCAVLYANESIFYQKEFIENSYIDNIMNEEVEKADSLDVILLYGFAMISEDDIAKRIRMLEKAYSMDYENGGTITISILSDLAVCYSMAGNDEKSSSCISLAFEKYYDLVEKEKGDLEVYRNLRIISHIVDACKFIGIDVDDYLDEQFVGNYPISSKILQDLDKSEIDYAPIWSPDSGLEINSELFDLEIKEYRDRILN